MGLKREFLFTHKSGKNVLTTRNHIYSKYCASEMPFSSGLNQKRKAREHSLQREVSLCSRSPFKLGWFQELNYVEMTTGFLNWQNPIQKMILPILCIKLFNRHTYLNTFSCDDISPYFIPSLFCFRQPVTKKIMACIGRSN